MAGAGSERRHTTGTFGVIQGIGLVIAGATAATLAGGCSSPTGPPAFFSAADCTRDLVELTRFSALSASVNSLAIGGGRLYLAYSHATASGAAPNNGGIVSWSTSGDAFSVAASAPTTTALWGGGAFWIDGDAIVFQHGDAVSRLPTSGGTLPTLGAVEIAARYAHDAAFAYAAEVAGDSLKIVKTLIAGGAAVTLLDETLPAPFVGGVEDFGDALLVSVTVPNNNTTLTVQLWRVPKDGSPRAEVRSDLDWQPVGPLAWDGTRIIAPALAPNNRQVLARAPPDAGPAQYLRFDGSTFTHRGGPIIAVGSFSATDGLGVFSSEGDGGTLLACGGRDSEPADPVGVAADDSGIYVAWNSSSTSQIVLARVPE